jgi:hypothetical protein
MRRLVPTLALLALVSCEEEPAPAPATTEVRGKPIASAPAPAVDPKALPTEVRALTGTNGVNLAADAPPATAPKEVGGYREAKFELLTSYDYEWSQTTGIVAPGSKGSQIPPEVRALDKQKVFVVGYMQPIDFDSAGVKTFLLTNYPGGCCFGMVPRLNEWVEVTLAGEERVDYSYFDAIAIYGSFQVGEAKSGEVVTSLYRMTPDKVELADAR